MNSNKKIWVALIVVAIIAIGGYSFPTFQKTTEKGLGAVAAPTTNLPSMGVVQLGLGTGCGDNFSTCLGPNLIGGGQVMAQATTTICAIQSPNATTTLTEFGIDFTTSSTTASVVTIAKAANAFATTTQIGNNLAIAANAEASFQASSTAAQLATNNTIIAPNNWIVVGMAGGVGNFNPVGKCSGIFTTF